jgi:hypothetical protein
MQYLQKLFLQPLQKTTSFGRFSHMWQQLYFKICLKTFFLSVKVLSCFSAEGEEISNLTLAPLERPTETLASSSSPSDCLVNRFSVVLKLIYVLSLASSNMILSIL